MKDRFEEALQLSEEILESIELEKIKLSSVVLRCLRLARLINDDESVTWLQYESTGYPRTSEGHIETKAFEIAYQKGRNQTPTEKDDTHKYIFAETVSELEAGIEMITKTTDNMTTSGVSVEGQMALLAMRELTSSVRNERRNIATAIEEYQKKLSRLRGNYYNYALTVSHQLKFGNQAESIFNQYRKIVEDVFSKIAPESLNKLATAAENITENNKESWAQAITSCRRVFQEVSEGLYSLYLPNSTKEYTTKKGEKISVSGDKYKNKYFALVDYASDSETAKNMYNANIEMTVSYISNLNELLCKGVHDEVSLEQARSGILHTYMTLGDLAFLIKNKNE